MRKGLASFIALSSVAAVVIVAACGGEVEGTKYGPPGGLQGKLLPGEGNTGTPAPTGDAGGGDPNCAVKFATQLHPKMIAAPWSCNAGSSCHGAGGSQPLVTTDAATTYNNFRAYKMKGSNKPYIVPGNTDVASGAMVCNMKGEAGCGNKMPPAGAAANDIADVETWVKCGSPNN
jgi:hypothetical protein